MKKPKVSRPWARGRGFAALTPEARSAIARRGGKAAHALGHAHKWNHAEAVRAGRIGGSRGRKVGPNKKKIVRESTAVGKKIEPRPLQDEDAFSSSIDGINTPANRCREVNNVITTW